MSKKEIINDTNEVKKEKHTLRNIIIFVVFFVLGFGVGYYGTTKFLEHRDKENDNTPVVEDDGIMDITEDEDSVELVNSLLLILDKDPMFYSTEGVSVNTLDNKSKLILVYNTLLRNNVGTKEEIASEVYGGTTCLNGFITDVGENTLISTNKCTVTRIKISEFIETNKKMFNDEILDTSVNFSPVDGTNCVVDGESYICGNVTKASTVSGELESVFSIVKVTKDEDGTIVIYEKGYLNDKRSNVNNPNDQYDNYYLHSSDSTDYYYELKSADNLTFKHTFKTTDRQNYYYVSTELVKE